jgi:hypothetical protein
LAVGRAVREFGEEPREVDACYRSKLAKEWLAQSRTKQFDPRGKGQNILAFTSAAKEEFGPPLSARREFPHEAGLADPGFTDHKG